MQFLPIYEEEVLSAVVRIEQEKTKSPAVSSGAFQFRFA
jgi:hypothetical protein